MKMKKGCPSSIKKKVLSHLSDDKRTFKEEVRDDEKLAKKLKKKK